MKQYRIRFEPEGITVLAEEGTCLLEAAQRAGIVLNSVCGGAGTCKKCLVEIAGDSGPVYACQYRINQDIAVEVPEGSRFFEQKILQEGIASTALIDPVVRKYSIQLSPPSLDDLRSDALRLTSAVDEALNDDKAGEACSGEVVLDTSLLSNLPSILQSSDYKLTAVCHGRTIIHLGSGDTTGALSGLAVDIGTTTVVATLVNLINGKAEAVASASNPQIQYGDDVISRIEYSSSHIDGLRRLHNTIIECLNSLIAEVCEKSGIPAEQIFEMTVAGNTTMQHLLLEIPVEQIARAPYVSPISSAVNLPAATLGVRIHPKGNVYVMPGIAGHVGGDTVAVALCTAMRSSERINLALDIGTNGEIVLGNRDRLLACSTAAGPAFEGARISAGMRGAVGAIERVTIHDDVELSVIGGGLPVGLCGSGLVDAVAGLLDAGLLDASGRMLSGEGLPEALSENLRQRLITIDRGPAFVLAYAGQTKQREDILLTQRDIREVQLAKAAIRAGITLLMKQLAIGPEDIDRLYLAGAFGNFIRPENARRIGLLPDLSRERIQGIGNAASTGAREVLLSVCARRRAEHIARDIKYVELAGRAEFQDLFTDAMAFPE